MPAELKSNWTLGVWLLFNFSKRDRLSPRQWSPVFNSTMSIDIRKRLSPNESDGSGSDISSESSSATGDGFKPKRRNRKRLKGPWTDKIIKQMMFVSGETQEPAPETTTLVEQIVQQQVKELVRI